MGQGIHTKVQQVLNPAGSNPGLGFWVWVLKNQLWSPAGGQSRASDPALQSLRQRNQHQHCPQHPAVRCVLRDRCQRHGSQGKVPFRLLCVLCYHSVITDVLVCSECLPGTVPAAGAHQAEVPQRILGELGMDGVCLRRRSSGSGYVC